ncbi:MAG: oligosaccharide flippase family protein [Kofleriaceae bacterium]
MSLAHKAARGAVWTILSSLGARAVGVAGTIVMTHLLAPEVIGEVSVAAIVAMTANWASIWGFGSYAVVKGRGDDAAEVMFHATMAYLVMGVVGLGAVALLGGHLAGVLDAPGAARFIPGMALVMFIRRMGGMSERVLMRRMEFRALGLQQALGELAYTVTAVALAVRGWGGDAIIVGNLVQAVVMTSIVMTAAGWRAWATPTRLSWARYRDMLRYGLPLCVQSVAHNGSRYWDNLTLAHLFGAGPTGLYNLAYNLADIPAVQVGEQLAQVLLPSMAALPPERRPRAFERSTALLSLIIFPLAVGLGVVATPLIAVALDDQWQGVAPLLTILAALSVFRPVTWVIGAYLEAQDRTGLLMRLELAKVIVLIGGMFALAPLGLHATAGAVGVAFGLTAIGGVWMVSKEGPRPLVLVRGFLQPLAACGVMVGAVLLVRLALGDAAPLLHLVVEILVGAAAYVGAAWILCRATARDLLELLRGALRGRRSAATEASP